MPPHDAEPCVSLLALILVKRAFNKAGEDEGDLPKQNKGREELGEIVAEWEAL